MELSTSGLPAEFPNTAFDWQPDAVRLEQEVRVAEKRGLRDELTLAEVECSLDLLDAELASPQVQTSSGKELTSIRAKLVALAMRLHKLPTAY